MKKILTGFVLAMTALPVVADDVQTPVVPMMPTPATMMTPQAPVKQMPIPQMQMPNMQQMYGGNNGSNWNMPKMNWGNGTGNGWNMPKMNWGNGTGNGWNMPKMNWGNGTGNGWNMPKMNWGNGTGNGWNMPNMNWGNNNSGWREAPMYMAVPIAPRAPMMRPSAPQLQAQQKTQSIKEIQQPSASDVVKQAIVQMQRLNAAIEKQLSATSKVAPKAEIPASVK